MATEKARRRKPAVASTDRTVKTSLVLSVELHSKLSAAASLSSQSNNAFITDVLTEALRGLVLIDRRKSGGQADPSSE